MAVRVDREEPAEGSNRPLDARAANDRIAEKAQRLQFHSRVPMLCECGRQGCQTLLMVSLPEYEQIRRDTDNFLTAPGHEIDGASLSERGSDYDVRRVAQRSGGDGDRRFRVTS